MTALPTAGFQSTHPVWGATADGRCSFYHVCISIHAPRVGCDGQERQGSDVPHAISIHAPRVGCDSVLPRSPAIDSTISIHAPRVGCDDGPPPTDTHRENFNPRTPCGVRLDRIRLNSFFYTISIHAPRVGCDCAAYAGSPQPPDFNPRTPCGVRRSPLHHPGSYRRFQSTHPVWGATTLFDRFRRAGPFQSTHPVWGATHAGRGSRPGPERFQSTHPVWGATTPAGGAGRRPDDFNPRTPCGVRRHVRGCGPVTWSYFNPRTPCGVRPYFINMGHAGDIFQSTHPVWGATVQGLAEAFRGILFQSTHPVWGATSSGPPPLVLHVISIHAPRVGCDRRRLTPRASSGNFNPRTPCGVRRSSGKDWPATSKFQSTHPVWGATCLDARLRRGQDISIHAPRVGCDCRAQQNQGFVEYFNPRTPCGVRQQIYTRYEVNRCVPCTDCTA